MRHGNRQRALSIGFFNGFRSYLRGMETLAITGDKMMTFQFRSYLRGMETPNPCFSSPFAYPIPILPMRHGNPVDLEELRSLFDEFRSYLWGMETEIHNCHSSCIREFRSYLWGMETTWRNSFQKKRFRFRSYLWGMETLKDGVDHLFCLVIPILPTRHGNTTGSHQWSPDTGNSILPTRHGNRKGEILRLTWDNKFDPTYEAWKHMKYLVRKSDVFPQIRSYLRGMETDNVFSILYIYRTNSILPTRHGNDHNFTRVFAPE